jgi:tRNA (Thr-GGU) A37 N-methylase
MTEPVSFRPIGIIRTPFLDTEGMPIQASAAVGVPGRIEIEAEFVEGLADLDGFSHRRRPAAGRDRLQSRPRGGRQGRGDVDGRSPRPDEDGLRA